MFDAHNHLQDERLQPWRDAILVELPKAGITEVVVNGSSEADWEDVAELARQHPWIKPSFGLHPWYVGGRSAAWRDKLIAYLQQFPAAGVGEIGLDRWIANPDVPAQIECFRFQTELAAEMERPATIHCLRAFGLLDETLRGCRRPSRGFLLHSYGGPAEMIGGFAALGGFFSLSPYFGHPRKAAQLAVFGQVPRDRLLAETDAPDMRPPDDLNPHPLQTAEGEALNHPLNLAVSYDLLGQVLRLSGGEAEALVEANYRRLFGP